MNVSKLLPSKCDADALTSIMRHELRLIRYGSQNKNHLEMTIFTQFIEALKMDLQALHIKWFCA